LRSTYAVAPEIEYVAHPYADERTLVIRCLVLNTGYLIPGI